MFTYLLIDLAIISIINLALWLHLLLRPPTVLYIKRLHLGGKGLALPNLILLTHDVADDSAVLRHEYTHIQQMKRYTPIGVALMLGWHYGRGYLIHILKYRSLPSFISLWRTNPLEIEANQKMHLDTPLPPVKGWPRK